LIDLDQVVEHLAEGLQVVDREYRYLYLNRVAAEHGQTTPEELVGRTMMEAYPGIEDSEMFAVLRRVMEERRPAQLENEFPFSDGTTRWFDLRMAPVPDGVVILSVETTQTKELTRQLVRAQRIEAIGQLAGGFAHDFNNLLTVIQACGSFLVEGTSSDQAHADVSQILDAAHRGADLTRKLLSFASRTPVAARSVKLAEALANVEALLRRTLGSDIRLTVRADESLGAVTIDPSALDQTLVNMALNARDAMPNGGSIVIEAERAHLTEQLEVRQGMRLEPGHYWVISVTDSGSGMEPDVVDRVFEPFFTTKGEGLGTGLGLATSWGLIRQAGGTISVYSEVGVGTTFRVYLPEARGDDPRVESLRGGSQVELAGRSVLVVEDRESIRVLVTRVLRGVGCRVVEARSGAEALLILEDVGRKLDLVVCDVVMPRMSGFELTAQVRRRFPKLSVLLISGYASTALVRREGAELPVPLLAKPFTPAQLTEAVRAALQE